MALTGDPTASAPRPFGLTKPIVFREVVLAKSAALVDITDSPVLCVGSGSPNGSLTKPRGSLFLRTDGSSDTLLYGNTDGGTTWVAYDNGGAGATQPDLIFTAATELTIATGAIAVTQGVHTVDTEADAASDALTDITGGTAEEVVLLRPANAARTVVITHAIGADKIACPGAQDISLAEATDWAMLAYDGTQWIVLAFSTLALGGGGLGAALASTANGKGASLVGIEDAAGLLAAGDVEAALLEMFKYVPVLVADPGDAAAIPVNKSVTVPFTTGAGGETGTLAIPTFAGQVIVMSMDVDGGGNRVVTVAGGVNLVGNTVITFASAGESRTLRAAQVAGALVWRDIGGDAALS